MALSKEQEEFEAELERVYSGPDKATQKEAMRRLVKAHQKWVVGVIEEAVKDHCKD